MKLASLLLLNLLLLACFNWFGTFSSVSDNYVVYDNYNNNTLLSSYKHSRNNVVILEKSTHKYLDFISPSKQWNHLRIIRKPTACVPFLLNPPHLFFQFYSLASNLLSEVAATRLPAFPLRI